MANVAAARVDISDGFMWTQILLCRNSSLSAALALGGAHVRKRANQFHHRGARISSEGNSGSRSSLEQPNTGSAHHISAAGTRRCTYVVEAACVHLI